MHTSAPSQMAKDAVVKMAKLSLQKDELMNKKMEILQHEKTERPSGE